MAVELPKLKQNFSDMIEAVTIHPFTMVQFIVWLDLKLAEYKVNGYMILDQSCGEIPDWLSNLNVDEPDTDTPEHDDHESQSSQDTIVQEPATQEKTIQDEALQDESDSLDNIKIIPITSDALSPPPDPIPAEEGRASDYLREESPILIENFGKGSTNVDNNKISAKRSAASDTTFSPVVSQVYTDVKRRRVVPTSSPSTASRRPTAAIDIANDEPIVLRQTINQAGYVGNSRQIGQTPSTESGNRDANRGVHIIRDPNRRVNVNPGLWDANPAAFREAGIRRTTSRLSSNDNIPHESSRSPSNKQNVLHFTNASAQQHGQSTRLHAQYNRGTTSNLPPFTDTFNDPNDRQSMSDGSPSQTVVSPRRGMQRTVMPHRTSHRDRPSDPVPTNMFVNNPEINQLSTLSDPTGDSSFGNITQSDNSTSLDESFCPYTIDTESDCQIKTEPEDSTDLAGCVQDFGGTGLGIREELSPELMICPRCSYTTSDLTSLNDHLQTHDALMFPCNICHDKFKDSRALKEHGVNTHAEKFYPCDICGLSSKSAAGLHSHKRRLHKDVILLMQQGGCVDLTGSSLYKCHMCDATFSSKWNRMRHTQSMHENKVFPCPCGAVFKWSSGYRMHNRKCPLAPKS